MGSYRCNILYILKITVKRIILTKQITLAYNFLFFLSPCGYRTKSPIHSKENTSFNASIISVRKEPITSLFLCSDPSYRKLKIIY